MSADIPQAAPTAEMQNWKAPTPGASADVLGINAPELNTKSAAEQLGLTDGAFKVKRGKGENAYVDTGWIVKRTDVDFDPDTKTNRKVVVLEDTKVDASDPTVPSSKIMWADDLLRMQEPESENAAEVAKAEEVIEDVGGVAIHSEVTVDTSETDQQVSATEEQNTSEASTADTTESTVDEAENATTTHEEADSNTPESQDVAAEDKENSEVGGGLELQQLTEAKVMLGSLAENFAPVEDAVQRLASATKQKIGSFETEQKFLLEAVGRSIINPKALAANIEAATRFVTQLNGDLHGEIGAQEQQAVITLINAVNAISQGMSQVEVTAMKAFSEGQAIQNNLAEALYNVAKSIPAHLEGFKQYPMSVRAKALEADQERSQKQEADTSYTSEQQQADNVAIGDVYARSGEVVQRTDMLTDEAQVAKNSITRAFDSGNFTSDILIGSGLNVDSIININGSLRTIVSKLHAIEQIRGKKGSMHAELAPLLTSMLYPIIDSVKRMQNPTASASEQPVKLGKIGVAVKELQRSTASTQDLLTGLRN